MWHCTLELFTMFISVVICEMHPLHNVPPPNEPHQTPVDCHEHIVWHPRQIMLQKKLLVSVLSYFVECWAMYPMANK